MDNPSIPELGKMFYELLYSNDWKTLENMQYVYQILNNAKKNPGVWEFSIIPELKKIIDE